MAAAVAGIALADDELALLQLVEKPHDQAAVVAERVGDLGLGLARVLLEQGEHGVVERRQPRALERRVGAILGGKPEALEQEDVAREQFLGRAREPSRSRNLGVRDVHLQQSVAHPIVGM